MHAPYRSDARIGGAYGGTAGDESHGSAGRDENPDAGRILEQKRTVTGAEFPGDGADRSDFYVLGPERSSCQQGCAKNEPIDQRSISHKRPPPAYGRRAYPFFSSARK